MHERTEARLKELAQNMPDDEKGDIQSRFGDGLFYETAMKLAAAVPGRCREKSLMLTKLEECQDWYRRCVTEVIGL